MNKERIPLLLIYKQDGQIKTQNSEEVHDYELYGFLKCYMQIMEEQLIDFISPREDEE